MRTGEEEEVHILPTAARNILFSRPGTEDEEQILHPAAKSLFSTPVGLHMLLRSGITQAIYINRELLGNHSVTRMQEQMTVV